MCRIKDILSTLGLKGAVHLDDKGTVGVNMSLNSVCHNLGHIIIPHLFLTLADMWPIVRYSCRKSISKQETIPNKLFVCYSSTGKAITAWQLCQKNHSPVPLLEDHRFESHLPDWLWCVQQATKSALYKNKCAVRLTYGVRVRVGLHQEQTLSPLLVALAVDRLTDTVRDKCQWTMMVADDTAPAVKVESM